MDQVGKLNKALKSVGSGGSGSVFHENETAILDAATKLLSKSETGNELLAFARDHGIVMHVIKSKEEFGAKPDKNMVFISCPANKQLPTAMAVLRLVGALRDAMQDAEGKLPRPDVRAGKDRYVQAKLNKSADIALYQTAVAYEIHQATGIIEIIDELYALGYRSIYESYKADQEAGLQE